MHSAALILIALAQSVPAATPASVPVATVTYSYPPQARAIPALRAWLDSNAAAFRSAVEAQAAADKRAAAREGRPFLRYDSERTWKVVADTPRFLSLSLERFDFTGGAHGNTGFASLVWDRAKQARLTTLSFFVGRDRLKAAIQPAFCRELNVQRRAKRQGQDGTIAKFEACIDPTAEAVILGSSTRQRFDRIGILVAPYQAGPYVEGSYDVTVPVTGAVLAAVKPEWRRYFAVAGASRGTP